jgi:hypothetical protein
MIETLLAGALLGFAPPAPSPDPVTTLSAEELGRTKRPDSQLRFYGFFLTRAEMTNVSPANDLFKGQVVGRLFGPNTTTTSKKRAVFLEQRFIPFFILEPDITARRARLRASFELDWTFGDASNSAGGNFGSAITADQVNLQTQNLAVEIDFAKNWSINIGLQRIWDTPFNAYDVPVDTLLYTGQRAAFWGTDAVGAVINGYQWGQTFKIGAYQLYENLIQEDDDVAMFELATDRHIMKTWHVGGSLRYLRDTSQGGGGIGILGQGPDSQLVEYTGGYRFTVPDDVEKWRGHFIWPGIDTSYNPNFTAGRLGASAFAVGNFGQIVTAIPGQPGDFQKLANILGLAANARVGVRYGRTPADHIVGEVMYTSGDHDGLEDGTYSGVVTGNTWGAPAAIYVSHGAYLLLPHANVVNRFYSAVSDISNMGFGMTAATLGVSYDIIRNKLTARIGGAAARSNIRPIGNSGNFIGAEVNGRISWRIRPLLNLEAHAAYLSLGDFFVSPEIVTGVEASGKPRNPWTTFLTLKWLLI